MPGTPDLIAAFKDLEEARPAYCEAEDMYSGEVDEVFSSAKVKRLLQRAHADEIEEFNYCHIPVDTVANRLAIIGVGIASNDDDGEGPDDGIPATETTDAATPAAKKGAGDGTAPDAAHAKNGNTAAQKALDDLWKDNQLDAESAGLHLKVSKQGDCYLIVWPASDDAGTVTKVDMRVNTAETVRVIYDAEDPLKVAYAIKSWTFDAPLEPDDEDSKMVQFTRANLYYDNRIERWISLPNKKGKALASKAGWAPYDADKKPAVIHHEYGRVPVFHFRNDRPYGKPEHLYAYGPQQMLNKLVMAQAVAVDYQSFPQRYLLMDPAADQTMGNLLDPNHPEDDDDPEGDSHVAQLSAEASAVWRLFGAKSAGQFEASSPDTFLKPFDRYVQAMAELTETPLYRFGSSFAQTPSGAALRSADAPVVAKVENRQDAYDAVWEDALEFGLLLLGFKDTHVQVSWKPAEQATDFEAWSVVGAKRDAGVPQKQALMETGYTEDQVDEWLAGDEAKDTAMRRKVDLLTSIADALQAVGAAVAMNVVTQPQVDALVAQVLGDNAGAAAADTGG